MLAVIIKEDPSMLNSKVKLLLRLKCLTILSIAISHIPCLLKHHNSEYLTKI